jgi:peptidoglycan/xylan/chitin deacetylase (PgdA/CDA1 family)
MYHKVSLKTGDELSVTPTQLREQWGWLRDEGFVFITGSSLLAALESGEALSPRAVLVTFDDAYLDNLKLALPLLRELAVPAVIFVPTAYVGQTNSWDREASPLMTVEQLRLVVAAGFELGLHSHQHENFSGLTAELIASDIRMCVGAFREMQLPFIPALAYPYGGRPKDKHARCAMEEVLRCAGLKAAFRIGNRINSLPLSNRYEINRLGIRGDESMAIFRRKIKWGRWF